MAQFEFSIAPEEIPGGSRDASLSRSPEPFLPYKRNDSNPIPGIGDSGSDLAGAVGLSVTRRSVVESLQTPRFPPRRTSGNGFHLQAATALGDLGRLPLFDMRYMPQLCRARKDRRQGGAPVRSRRKRAWDPRSFRAACGKARTSGEADSEGPGSKIPKGGRVLSPSEVRRAGRRTLGSCSFAGRRARPILGPHDPSPDHHRPDDACFRRGAHALASGRCDESGGHPKVTDTGRRASGAERTTGRRKTSVVGTRSRTPTSHGRLRRRTSGTDEPAAGCKGGREAGRARRGAPARLRRRRSGPHAECTQLGARVGAGSSEARTRERITAALAPPMRAVGAECRSPGGECDGSGIEHRVRCPRIPGAHRNG